MQIDYEIESKIQWILRANQAMSNIFNSSMDPIKTLRSKYHRDNRFNFISHHMYFPRKLKNSNDIGQREVI